MKNLIFDFDGVIADTYKVWTKAQKQLNAKAGNSNIFVDLNVYATKKPNHTRDHTLTDEELAHLYERVIEGGKIVHQTGFELFNDFVSEIKLIDSVHKAIVSSGSQMYVLPALAETGIEFTHILAYEDHHSKEEKIELVCSDWGVSIDDVYYFTDTLADVYELRNLIHKDRLIGVSWGYCTKEQLLTELSAENILDTAKDLARVITC